MEARCEACRKKEVSSERPVSGCRFFIFPETLASAFAGKPQHLRVHPPHLSWRKSQRFPIPSASRATHSIHCGAVSWLRQKLLSDLGPETLPAHSRAQATAQMERPL